MLKSMFIIFILSFFSIIVTNANSDHNRVCDGLSCETEKQCSIRKFWCDYSICPEMRYCAISRLESLRGPETCESVICPVEYKCVLRVHKCTWNFGCEQSLARCISDVEFADEPTSCTNVECERGHHCILREAHSCLHPPCPLTKICAYSEDVKIWFEKCRRLGCRSEHECFLRRPSEKCAGSSCGYIPDCLVTPSAFDSSSSILCHGWICPPDHLCLARLPPSCGSPSVNCPILRSCHLPAPTEGADVRTTLTDIERDIFSEEQHRAQPRVQQFRKPSFTFNFTQTKFQQYYDNVVPIASQLQRNWEDDASFPMNLKRVSVSPILLSTSQRTGDSAWLTYLKRQAGAEAVRYWIDKAKSNQDYEGFREWLDTVAELLDPDTYHFWLMEVESASAHVPEFQAWISSHHLATQQLAAAASVTQRALPVSIADKAKNLIYRDMPQDFGEAVKNPWQSYYQFKPSSSSRFAGQSVEALHLANDYTRARQNTSVPQMFFVDDRYATTLKQEDDVLVARSFAAIMNQIGGELGLQNFRQNVAELDPNQSTTQLFSSTLKNNAHPPNLLIYFPPPFNFFIYYSVESHNHNRNISWRTGNEDSNSKSEVGIRMFDMGSYVPEDYDDNPNFYNKTGPINKQKEFQFIRNIIRELINYWDDEERSFGKSKNQTPIENVGVRIGNIEEKTSVETNTQNNKIKPHEAEGKPALNKFLEWLDKNGHVNLTQLPELNSKRKNPQIQQESDKQNFNSPELLYPQNNTNTTAGKIHILIDIDKNPEIIKNLFSRNYNKKDNDTRQYQMVVNLNEYVDPQEENEVSKKLINIASKQLHRNITGNEKMPKVLWVFPVYKDEENETILNEIKKRSKEKINTLEDVDVPTKHTDSKVSSHYTRNNPDAKIENDIMDGVKNVDSINDPSQNSDLNEDTEEEYYDDEEMYYEDEYEPSEINESMKNYQE